MNLSRAELHDGYVRVMTELYEPNAFFDRADDLLLKFRMPHLTALAKYRRKRPWQRLHRNARTLVEAGVLLTRILRAVPDKTLRRVYRERVLRMFRTRPEPDLLMHYVIKCALHFHQYTLARDMATGEAPILAVGGTGALVPAPV